MVPEPDAVRSVLIDVREGASPESSVLELAGRFSEKYPSVKVLLLTDEAERLALGALRHGVTDLLDPDASIEDLRLVLRRSANGGVNHSETFSGRVITIASPKGGVGKTTLATNVAVGLAAQAPKSTVLVDLDIQFGDVAAALDLDPTYTLGDIVVGPGLTDPIALKTLLAQHPSGLQVVCGVHSPAEADVITPQHIDALLRLLKKEFRYVVIDTAPGMSEQTLAAIDHATDLVLVTSLDVPGVRGLRKELQLLDDIELQPATRHIVINFEDATGGLTVKDVEAAIERPVDLVLERSAKVPRTTNQGTPIIAAMPRDKVSRTISELVSRFAHISAPQSRWGGRHRGRLRP
ncbi:MinD/ParA family protein [Ornithinimicrobium avium]|uniref:MinD/ParA family protein n=2 Tax=Ornithinimicrobium avium TaxID=2283195 RepID=A0A345NSE0_9MICO|nr:MinD/ParA family protein [Ornithinimicrobium avium]